MSYYMLNGFGGLGATSHKRSRKMVMHGYGATAATTGTPSSSSGFNASSIWSDCLSGSSGNNAAGKRCGQSVQMGLNALGYGPLTVDGQIGPASIAAIKAFGQDNGFGAITWPTQAMLIKMQELLAAGAKPGPGEAVESHVVGGQVVPGAAPGGGALGKAGLSTGMLLGIGAAVVVGIGVLALAAKKKPSGSSSSSSSHTTHA